MTLWEITLAELLAPLGYTSAMFGKWHVGNAAGRAPTHQGFDEWYGIRDSSNESQRSTMNDTPYIWEGKAGEPSRPVKEFNLETRRDRSTARPPSGRSSFMKRSTQAAQAVLPLPAVHADSLPDAAAPGVRRARPARATSATRWRRWTATWASSSTRSRGSGIERNTIVIWASDGGAEARRPWRGTAGPWRGFYNTAHGRRHPHAVS